MFDNYVVEIEENKMLDIRLMKKLPLKSSFKIMKSIMPSGDITGVNVDIHRKKIYVIVEGEEVYIKLITIPRVNYSKIEDLIRGELLYYFKEIENILFTYSILKEADRCFEVIVFCLNADKIDVLQKSFCDISQVKGIYLIQFCILNFMKKTINEDNFNVVFSLKKSLYLMEVKFNILKKNRVIKEVMSSEEFKFQVDDFIKYKISSYNDENTYFVNIDNKVWIEEYIKEGCFKDLGRFSEKEIIENSTINSK